MGWTGISRISRLDFKTGFLDFKTGLLDFKTGLLGFSGLPGSILKVFLVKHCVKIQTFVSNCSFSKSAANTAPVSQNQGSSLPVKHKTEKHMLRKAVQERVLKNDGSEDVFL
jgi:hypothetical protein